MSNFCFSCGMPLENAEPSTQFCQYCVDQDGKLLPPQAVQQGIGQWLRSWQTDLDEPTSLERAKHYMLAMPAWQNMDRH